MKINQYLRLFLYGNVTHDRFYRSPAPQITCKDGFHISVQAGYFLYSSPKEDGLSNYTHVECGFPSEEVAELMEYIEELERDPKESIYAFVPVEIVDKLIEKHGGIDWDKVIEFLENRKAKDRNYNPMYGTERRVF